MPTRPVGILGGMGPAAGADFVRLFVQACADLIQRAGEPVTDQAFPEHWLLQAPVPDRTGALESPCGEGDAVLPAMAAALGRLQSLGVQAVAMACNTAHAWHGALQARFAGIELLHVAREVATHLRCVGVRRVALLGTRGLYRSMLYEISLAEAGIVCHLPTEAEREILMRGIYDGVKAGDIACAQACFSDVARRLTARHGDLALIQGCTEIPIAMPAAAPWILVNPSRVLAQALAGRAFAPVSRFERRVDVGRPAA